MPGPALGLALQGGGSHGAYTWGVLDRVLQEVEAGRLEIAAISGASAGSINAAVTAAGLVEGGPALARTRLAEFWRGLAERGERAGNSLFGFAEPGPFGYNIDWSPGAIVLEAAGLVISPYTNPFYADCARPADPGRCCRRNGWPASTPAPGRACSSARSTSPTTRAHCSRSRTSPWMRSAPPPACRPSSGR